MKVAVIPARGGSKRIPRKNILPFCGKPIIAYSIETAISSKLFDKVIVSTDDEEIASISRQYGSEVPFLRPSELSNDYAGTHEVIGHAIKELTDSGDNVDFACCIYPTAPLIQKNDLQKGFELLEEGCWDSVFAATSFSYPIFRSFKYKDNGGLKMLFPEHYHSRSQDLPMVMHDAGQFYWASAKVWIEPPKAYDEKSTVVLLPSWRVQDIDTLEDWKRAENIYKLYNLKVLKSQ